MAVVQKRHTVLKDIKCSHVYSVFLKSFKATTSPTAFKVDFNITLLPDLDISTMKQNNDKLASAAPPFGVFHSNKL